MIVAPAAVLGVHAEIHEADVVIALRIDLAPRARLAVELVVDTVNGLLLTGEQAADHERLVRRIAGGRRAVEQALEGGHERTVGAISLAIVDAVAELYGDRLVDELLEESRIRLDAVLGEEVAHGLLDGAVAVALPADLPGQFIGDERDLSWPKLVDGEQRNCRKRSGGSG